MDGFEDAVFQTISKYSLLSKGERVLVAVSGGSDSVALLLALLEWRSRLDLKVEAAHVNHLLRGVESDQDEEFVRALCATLKVRLEVNRVETQRQAADGRQNLEECARRLRYDFFLAVAAQRRATVATGHTLNDLSETFLLKLFRGAGVSGLSGVYPRRRNQLDGGRTVDVVRPLIDRTRSEILGYLERRRQPFRQDSSNRDLSFDRNRVRHELMPLLEARFNPAITGTLGRTAGLFREMEDFLSKVLDEKYQQCRERLSRNGHRNETGPASVSLRIPDLLSQHPFVQREIVRRALREYRGDLKDVSRKNVEDILRIATGHSGAECHPGAGVWVGREFDLLTFARKRDVVQFEYELSVPGSVYIGEVEKRIFARRLYDSGVFSTSERNSVFLNFAGPRLRVRNRRAGDRYRVGAWTKKLKQLLIEKRIPRSLRDELLILEDGERVIWVEGFEPDPEFRAEPGSVTALEIRVEHETFPREGLLSD